MAPDPEAAWIRGFRRIAGELSSEAKAELCSLATSALESAKEDLRKALEEELLHGVLLLTTYVKAIGVCLPSARCMLLIRALANA